MNGCDLENIVKIYEEISLEALPVKTYTTYCIVLLFFFYLVHFSWSFPVLFFVFICIHFCWTSYTYELRGL